MIKNGQKLSRDKKKEKSKSTIKLVQTLQVEVENKENECKQLREEKNIINDKFEKIVSLLDEEKLKTQKYKVQSHACYFPNLR